jgi:hypothetical protein
MTLSGCLHFELLFRLASDLGNLFVFRVRFGSQFVELLENAFVGGSCFLNRVDHRRLGFAAQKLVHYGVKSGAISAHRDGLSRDAGNVVIGTFLKILRQVC